MLPLPKSLDIPIGLIGNATLGALGVRTRCWRLLRQPDASYWLNHPMVIDRLNAVASAPSQFANPWYARSWIHNSVKSDPTPEWNNPADYDIWAQSERSFAFGLHLDFILATPNISARVRKSFQEYLANVFMGLLTPNSGLDQLPLKLSGQKSKPWPLAH
jgi:hypothetical protein